MSGFNNLIFTTTSNGQLNISSQTTTGVPIEPVAPSTDGLFSTYALLNSPTFTGTPTAPTPDVSNNSTRIATTAYVRANRAESQTNIDLKADNNSPALTGIPTAPTPDVSNNSTQIATTAYVRANRAELQNNINLKADIASPTFTGTPTAPTPAVSTNSTQIATTAYVRANRAELQTNIDLKADKTLVDASFNLKANITNVDASFNLKADKTLVDASFTQVNTSLNSKATKTLVDASFTNLDNLKANKNLVDASFNLKANIDSPIFTGIPEAPTPNVSINNQQIATTAYVYNEISNLINGAPEALDTLLEIGDALRDISNNVLALMVATKITTDASFNLKADKSLVDASFTQVNTSLNSKADKTLVDASFTQVDASFTQVNTSLNSKADKTLVDASFAQVIAHVDASFARVDASFAQVNTRVDASFSQVIALVDASFAQVNTSLNSKADKTLVDSSFALVDASFALVDASLNLKADDDITVHINTNEVITGKKQFTYNPSNSSDNGNEFGLFGGNDGTSNYDPTFVGIIGNNSQSTTNLPSWNDCGMDIKSNAVRFYNPLDNSCNTMIDSVRGKFWGNGFCIRDVSNTVVSGFVPTQNYSYVDLTIDGLSSSNSMLISTSSSLSLNSGSNMSITATNGDITTSCQNTSMSSTQNTSIISGQTISITSVQSTSINSTTSSTSIKSKTGTTLSSQGNTTIDASQNILIGTNTNGSTSIKSMTGTTLSSRGNITIDASQNTTIDASQNIFIGTNTNGSIIMGNYNSPSTFQEGTNLIAPGFLTIGKSISSRANAYNMVGIYDTSINTIIFPTTSSLYSIVAEDVIGCSEFHAFSDLRLKENVDEIDISEAINLIKNIKPVTFDWKDSKKQTSGFIAQDILKNKGPNHLVSMISEHDLEETVDSDNFVSPAGSKFVVNYNGFIPYYHKVIKNLVERIEELEKKI